MSARGLTLGIASAACALLACQEEFTPATVVNELRVLGIRAQPAELRPGETAALTALVVDPGAPARRNTLLWIACDPDPADLNRTACSDVTQFQQSSQIVQGAEGGAPQLPPGMKLAGFGDRAFYSVPQDLFAALPADDPRRQKGTVAQLLLIAIGEEVSPAATPDELNALFERVQNDEVPSVVSIFRIPVSERAVLNQNPIIGDLLHDSLNVPESAHVRVRPGDESLLRLTSPAEAFEEYEQLVPEGVERRTERLIAALYSTFGRFQIDRLAVNEDVDSVFAAPREDDSDDPIPDNRRGRFWIVVRDTRGGQSWREHPLFVCDAPQEPPAVFSVARQPTAAGELLVLEGQRLDRILDVMVGPAALRDVRFNPVTGRLDGLLPPLPAGEHAVSVRTRDCVEYETGHRVRIDN